MMATASFAVAANNTTRDMNQVPSPPRSYPPSTSYANNGTLPHTPPSNISPTTFYSHMHAKQLRTPKQPLYTPACLRKTVSTSGPQDIPGCRAPLTPPQSKENSFDSAKSKSMTSLLGMPSVVSPLEDDFDMLRRGISRAGSEVVDEALGDVTGPPTTAHWKPNQSASSCAICQTSFTWYFRRHHCRKCGDVVCGAHFTHTVPLDQNARYHPSGAESKACDVCSREWRQIKKLRHSRTGSLADSMNSSQGTAMPPIAINRHLCVDPAMQVGSMAHSEGREWSTF